MAPTESLAILAPGLQTTVQDRGRFGYGRFGVAPSGALDAFALRIANLLVGNPENQACLETTLLGLRVKALAEVLIAVTGADLQPQINERPLKMWRSCLLKQGDILSFRGPKSGCRAYIAVHGGFSVSPVLGSKSTNLPSGFGGYEGRSLQSGDILLSDSWQAKPLKFQRVFKPEWIPTYPDNWILRVIWGPQHEDFTEEGRRDFLNSSYRVSSQSDRTGIRLEGPMIQRRSDIPESLISEGVISGSIQVPGDGRPIIILAETVTGGYRKIATIISADLSALGQIRPGDAIRFKTVTLNKAYKLLKYIEKKIILFKESITNR